MFELWYRELGFYNNPFSIKPAAFTNDVVGHNLKTMFQSIDSGKILFITGPFGTGKTTLLKNIIGRYGGQKRIVYFSCGLERSMQVDSLIRGAGNMLNKIIGGSPRNLIFLIDEANDIVQKDVQDLFEAYQDGIIKSIVFVGTIVPSRKFPPGLSSELKGNVIDLHNLPPAAAVSLVRKRIGSLPVLSDAVIREVHRKAGGNTRLVLEYCEELCRLAVSRGLNSVSKSEVDELFPVKKVRKTTKKAAATKRKRKPREQAIEEAVFEVEDESPVVEGLANISEDEPLPDQEMYSSPIRKKKKRKST